MKLYTAPALTEFGDVQTLTAADGRNNRTDLIFFNGVQVGTSNGSLDACVAEPPMPGSTCE